MSVPEPGFDADLPAFGCFLSQRVETVCLLMLSRGP